MSDSVRRTMQLGGPSLWGRATRHQRSIKHASRGLKLHRMLCCGVCSAQHLPRARAPRATPALVVSAADRLRTRGDHRRAVLAAPPAPLARALVARRTLRCWAHRPRVPDRQLRSRWEATTRSPPIVTHVQWFGLLEYTLTTHLTISLSRQPYASGRTR